MAVPLYDLYAYYFGANTADSFHDRLMMSVWITGHLIAPEHRTHHAHSIRIRTATDNPQAVAKEVLYQLISNQTLMSSVKAESATDDQINEAVLGAIKNLFGLNEPLRR